MTLNLNSLPDDLGADNPPSLTAVETTNATEVPEKESTKGQGKAKQAVTKSTAKAKGKAKTDGGMRFNEGKPRLSLVPFEFLQAVATVLTFGAVKYDAWNWTKGLSYTETYDSLQRHLGAWLAREDTDEESGLHHLWHAGCNICFLIYFTAHGNKYKKFDDRQPKV